MVKSVIANFVHSDGQFLANITAVPAQSITTTVCGSKPNQRRNGSFPTSQKNTPSCGFALGMTDAVTLCAPSRLPRSRPLAIQRIWTHNTRSRVRAPLWQNKSEFQYLVYKMMQRAPVLLSIRRQLVCIFPQDQAISCCRSESGDLIFVCSSLLPRVFT